MQIPVITHLAETQTLVSLQAAETALLAYQPPEFEVAGTDSCEQLTHVLVAQVLLHYMHEHGATLPAAVRAFAQRVRSCISLTP
jgi:hypothetical protein